MATVEEALSASEGFAVTLAATSLDVEREAMLTRIMQMKSWLADNPPVRNRISQAIVNGIPWTRRERLGTFLQETGGVLAVGGISPSGYASLSAFGTRLTGALGLVSSQGPLLALAVAALCTIVICYSVGDLIEVLRGLLDWLRAAPRMA